MTFSICSIWFLTTFSNEANYYSPNKWIHWFLVVPHFYQLLRFFQEVRTDDWKMFSHSRERFVCKVDTIPSCHWPTTETSLLLNNGEIFHDFLKEIILVLLTHKENVDFCNKTTFTILNFKLPHFPKSS